MGEKQLSASGRSAGRRPLEADLSQLACDRATRIAKALFNGADAQVILLDGLKVWRSREPGRNFPLGPGVRQAVESGCGVWIEDGQADPGFHNHPLVLGPPHLRFFAAHPIRLADGSTPGVLAVSDISPKAYNAGAAARLRDVAEFVAGEWERSQTARTRASLQLERETMGAKLAALLHALPVALVMTDREHRIVGCSPAWASDMGTTEADALGKSLAAVAPRAFARWWTQIQRVLQGESFTLDKARNAPGSGTARWISLSMAPWREPGGEIAGAIISTHDVTELVDALEAASRSEERLTLAMELSNIHVWEVDYVRRELIKMGAEETFFTEATTYEQLVRDPFSVIDPRDRPQAQAAWARQDRCDVFQHEHRVVRSDGEDIWASSASRLITDADGKPTRVIGAMQNTTERKAAETALLEAKLGAEAANQAKSAFLAAMSHEIRTPLNGVLGMAQAMASGDLSPVQADRLEVIRRSGENLLTILNHILDLSKIEAGKLELETVEFDLTDLATSVQALYSDAARGKGLCLEVVIEDAARGLYLGDVTRARQILQNLVSNAIKFTATGGVQVSIAVRDAGLQFEVADSGIGVPAARLGRLFEKFEQGDLSTTRQYGGTGLGLAICRELAELLGGSISAASVEGQGTRFTVILPFQRVGEARAVSQPATSPDLNQGLRRVQVLAAEDNSVNQLVLRTLLNQAGVDPVIVSNGAEAVAAWRDREWDVILMDVQMPIMDGPEATRIIRKLERELGRRRTPILALTANAMSHQTTGYLEDGMDGLVAKPVQVEALFSALASVLASVGEPAAAVG